MRTVIFVGLMSIAEAIGKQTGWVMDSMETKLGVAVLLAAIILDISDIFFNIYGKNTNRKRLKPIIGKREY